MYRPEWFTPTRMKTLFVWTLLAVMPSASMRIICIPGAPPPAESSAQPADGHGCEMLCSKQAHTRVRTKCVLVEDPSCGFALASPVAIVPGPTPLTFVRTVQALGVVEHTIYRVPSLDRAGPPPKA
jgi:hypothetical protein